MRKLMVLALMGALGTSAVVVPVYDAHAKPKKGDTEATPAEGEEEVTDVVMVATGSDALDSIFKKSEGPIETMATLRDEIRGVNTKLVESLGLTQGTPFKDALMDLQTKAEGKINVSFAENKWPTFSAAEGCPENVKASISTLNSSMVELTSAEDKLKDVGKQMGVVAEEAADLAAEPKNLGLSATQAPKAVLKSKKNIKALNMGVDVTKDLVKELGMLVSDVQSVFKASEEPAE